jgi:hypothetical protein
MTKPKIYKFLRVSALLFSIGVIVYYFQLSNRHKAIVKTFVLQKTGFLNADWMVKNATKSYQMQSPTFLIDGIYKSMEGPKASRYIQLDSTQKLLWMTGFEVKAFDNQTNIQVSNDFICHMNVDINDQNYYSNWNLEDRIGKQYPRLTSLSHGLEKFDFPEGYGVPIIGSDFLFVTTQTLNHNIPKIFKKIHHEVTIKHIVNENLKPLMSKTVFIQLPYDKQDPYKNPLDPASNQCIPVETKNHTYEDTKGNRLSGHWVIPLNKKTYRSSITNQLQINDSLRLHFSAPHVHPFATSISVFDKTDNKNLFTCQVTNQENKIGISEIETFSSTPGIWLYANHKYELVLETNNTSKTEQDMMGSMFLFFYDQELDMKIQNKKTQN